MVTLGFQRDNYSFSSLLPVSGCSNANVDWETQFKKAKERSWLGLWGVVFPLAIMSGVTYPSMRGGFWGLILRAWGELLLYGVQRNTFSAKEKTCPALFHLGNFRNMKFSFSCLASCTIKFLIIVKGEQSNKAALSFPNFKNYFPVQVSLPALTFV